jgi:hypothetical protein
MCHLAMQRCRRMQTSLLGCKAFIGVQNVRGCTNYQQLVALRFYPGSEWVGSSRRDSDLWATQSALLQQKGGNEAC